MSEHVQEGQADPAQLPDIRLSAIKTLPTPDGKGTIRVIIGSYESVSVPAATILSMTLFDMHLPKSTSRTR